MRFENHNKKYIKLTKYCIQLAAFLLAPGLFITIYQSLIDIVTAVIQNNFDISTLAMQTILVSGIFLITIFWGRFFCGWLCSFGAMGDLIYALSRILIPKKITIPEKIDQKLKWLKYAVLAFLVIDSLIWSFSLSSSMNPWNVFGGLTSGNMAVAASVIKTAGFVLFVCIAAGSFLIERFFCRYFCPLGAIFALISKCRLFKIRRKEHGCTSCALCTRQCSMGIQVHSSRKVTSGECINCMNCVTACPENCIDSNPVPVLAGTTAAVSIAGFVLAGRVIPSNLSNSTTVEAQSSGSFKDGTYTGTGEGYRGETAVTVTVEQGQITDITITSYQDDDDFFNKAKTTIVEEILSSQSIQVETVSGATFSSNGIIKAVANALGEEVTLQEGSENHEQNNHHSFGRGRNHHHFNDFNPSGEHDDTPDTEHEFKHHSDQDTSRGNTPSIQEPDLSKIEDGTYSGSGTGFRGTTKVNVTVKDHKITDITIESYEDDEQFFDRAKTTVIEAILSSQSLNVSTVSGATFSSNGIIEAAANALQMDNSNSAL